MDSTPGIRPRPTLWRRLDAAARATFPATTTAVLLLLTSAPLGLPGQAQMQPAIGLACVYFWSLFRPAAMPPPVVFALGLLTDLLGMEPLGVAVLTLLIAHGLALSWRRTLVKQGFLLVWLTFVAVAAAAATLQWFAISLLTFTLLPIGPGIFQFALTAGLYPALATLFTRAHRTLAAPERA